MYVSVVHVQYPEILGFFQLGLGVKHPFPLTDFQFGFRNLIHWLVCPKKMCVCVSQNPTALKLRQVSAIKIWVIARWPNKHVELAWDFVVLRLCMFPMAEVMLKQALVEGSSALGGHICFSGNWELHLLLPWNMLFHLCLEKIAPVDPVGWHVSSSKIK